MSDSVLLSRLPRFDGATEGQVKLGRGLAFEDFDLPAQSSEAFEPELESDMAAMTSDAPEEDLPEPELADEPPLAELPDVSGVEEMIAALSAAVQHVEQAAADQVAGAIQSAAAKLFPELSRQFLAEEIGQHLRALTPVSVEHIEIRATPAMAEALEGILARSETLAGRCILKPVNGPDDTQVNVSWRNGGLDFDFSGLMEACLARLSPTQAEAGA
ncbi:MAG: hypothetical protein MRY64_01165 [Hyphomonadaceae bacterium]|nr:hypothetical protein [Hyphomonadaceae bacterium]